MEVRNALESEITVLAQLWYSGWQDAHAKIVPEPLARLRTQEDFEERMRRGLANVRVFGPVGDPMGFYIVNSDELNQIYVRVDARGTGVARALIDDAERRIAESGYDTAWLACAIGNDRAAKFYEKCGWHLERIFTYEPETPDGTFRLDVWRYEKNIRILGES